MDLNKIRYRDLAQRELEERKRLRNRLNQLDRTAKSRGGTGDDAAEPIYFTVEEKAERDLLYRLLTVVGRRRREVVDPIWVTARDLFNAKPGLLNLLSNEVLGNPEGDLYAEPPGVALTRRIRDSDGRWPSHPLLDPAAVHCALVVGLLLADDVDAPRLVIDVSDLRGVSVGLRNAAAAAPVGAGNGPDADGLEERDDDDTLVIHADRNDPNYGSFSKAFFRVLGEAEEAIDLAPRVLNILASEGDLQRTANERFPVVDAEEFARVIRKLVERGVTEAEPQLRRKVADALDRIQNVDSDDVVSEIGIDLPDLEEAANNEIVADNVRLMGPVIASAMLDELKAFQVVDRILEQAQAGTLPIGQGKAGKLLYKRWKEAPNRISEPERRNLYAMTMGQPGGDPTGNVNREFNELWLRFVSSVSSFVRQHDVDKLLRASLPSAIGHQQVRKAARDLATNLSLHGYGMTYYAALELQGEVKAMIELLQDVEIRSAFGAKDMWQVIDTVATMDLGGARTSSRYRTLATCGAIITAWLANNVERIMRPTGPLIDITDVRSPMPRSAGQKATSKPTDYDLVNACELWLADTATTDTRIEELSQPRETPVMTSKPVPIPAFAREFLDEIPGFGMGLGGRGANGAGVRH